MHAGSSHGPQESLPSLVSLISSLGLTSCVELVHSRKNVFIALLGDPKCDKGALG